MLGVRQSQICGREQFRHRSYVSPVAHSVICGLGCHGYLYALAALSRIVGGEA
ncbi:MAG: type II 3-dehydroquinate dehydratase [Proteobacteria bacterium]|nr:type II 3-dehydroquinate dehydratase [Pseudomonadota bacterium]MBI3708680.1 type II 3-dehydroquinate dehydratase [Pseudomonadota bacterium]